LLDGGTALFDDLRQTVKNIASLADPSVGEVRVGCNPFLAATFVSAVVDQLSRRYPRVVFRLVTAYVETLHRELIERNVDFLIARRFTSIADERLDYELLFDDSYSVVVGTQNPWARRRRIELGVLPPPESGIGSVIMEAFRASGLDYPRATVVADFSEARMSLLTTGRFLTISPNSAYRFSARRPELKVLPIKQSLGHAPVGIVILKNRTISPLAQLFVKSCRELAKQAAKKIR
jgi:DNA-binding transcriptional LysR family regulator